MSAVRQMRRALKVLAMTDTARLAWTIKGGEEVELFLREVDEVVPKLVRTGWAEHRSWTETPGAVAVTTGNGDLAEVVITARGRRALGA